MVFPLIKKPRMTGKSTGVRQPSSEPIFVDPCRADLGKPLGSGEDYAGLLAGCRALFKETLPRLDAFGRLRLQPRKTLYHFQMNEDLKAVLAEWDTLMEHGKVVWAGLLMANSRIYESDAGEGDDHPALVAYSPDGWFDQHPEELAALAADLNEKVDSLQKDPGFVRRLDPEMADLCRKISDPLVPMFQATVPAKLTGGREVRLTTIMLYRAHFPERKVVGEIFPLLAAPDRSRTAAILPSLFWPDTLLRHQNVPEAVIRLRQHFSPPDLPWLVEQLRSGGGFSDEELDIGPGESRIRHFQGGTVEGVCDTVGLLGWILLLPAAMLFSPVWFGRIGVPVFLSPLLDWIPQVSTRIWESGLGLAPGNMFLSGVFLAFLGLTLALGAKFTAARARFCRFVDLKEGCVGRRLEITGWYKSETIDYCLADVLLLFQTIGPREARAEAAPSKDYAWWDLGSDDLGSTNRYENTDCGGLFALEVLLENGQTQPFFQTPLSCETGPNNFIARRWADLLGLKWLRRDIRIRTQN